MVHPSPVKSKKIPVLTSLHSFWTNLRISRKLYFVVGVMALLITAELLALGFTMRVLLAARAFVGGEGLWSKAQKNAVLCLQRFGMSGRQSDYDCFVDHLRIQEGDHRARLALEEEVPNRARAREGFLQGRIHPDDIEPMIDLLTRFSWISYLRHATELWAEADGLITELRDVGEDYYQLVRDKTTKPAQRTRALTRIHELNDQLTIVENEFSHALGEGSRWLEGTVMSLLFFIVLSVEGIGIALTLRMSRMISRRLSRLSEAAARMGSGDFTTLPLVDSRDEIGVLTQSLVRMGEMLQMSYTELEQRVNERTALLAAAAEEKARLYQEARSAVQVRDEFLSIASHELKTPITALMLQVQLLEKQSTLDPENRTANQAASKALLDRALNQTRRLAVLVDELLDLTRLRLGRVGLSILRVDLVKLIHEAAEMADTSKSSAGKKIRVHVTGELWIDCDPVRISQVIVNLFTNAIKYGDGKPVDVYCDAIDESRVQIRVCDQGIGISPEDCLKIFERYERVSGSEGKSGFGLGLYISRQIVEAHGGHVSVDSKMGVGSTFSVVLPVLSDGGSESRFGLATQSGNTETARAKAGTVS